MESVVYRIEFVGSQYRWLYRVLTSKIWTCKCLRSKDTVELTVYLVLLYVVSVFRKWCHCTSDPWLNDDLGVDIHCMVVSETALRFLLNCLIFDSMHSEKSVVIKAIFRSLLTTTLPSLTIDEMLPGYGNKCSYSEKVLQNLVDK